MGINPRTKGQSGEREIIDILNGQLIMVMNEMDYPQEEKVKMLRWIQRNQNQSAVGGNDLSNTFGLSIEIKRQETLAINQWWLQCRKAAEQMNETPVLIYRQNKKPWRVITYIWIPLPGGGHVKAQAEFDIETFRVWFREWVRRQLLSGWKAQS